MKYLQLTVETTHEFADIVAGIMLDNGSEGTAVWDTADFKEALKADMIWDYVEDGLLCDQRVLVSGYFDADFDAAPVRAELQALKRRCQTAGCLTLTAVLSDSEDWENVWKQYYRPLEIGRLVVVPKWLDADSPLVKVLIDPGMAFGTGSHESTAMCLKILSDLDLDGKTVFDVGCGSGILGIAALKLGAARARLTDVDGQAVAAAAANAALNNVQEKAEILQSDLLGGGAGKADVIIANITADILLRLLPALKASLVSRGYVILSGIINARAGEVLAAYEKEMSLVRLIKEGEWQAMLFRL